MDCLVSYGMKRGILSWALLVQGLGGLLFVPLFNSSNISIKLFGIERETDPIVEYLLTLGYKVYLVCPNMMKSLRKRYSSTGKYNDEFDSYIIADTVRTDRNRLTQIEPRKGYT